MTYLITDDCVACGCCSVACPHDAVSDGFRDYGSRGGKESRFYRITESCRNCGACAAVCPTGAIQLL